MLQPGQINLPADADTTNVMIDNLLVTGMEWGMNILTALIILFFGLIIAGWIKKSVRKLLGRSKRMDAILVGFLSSLVYYLALAIVFIAVIGNFGIQTTSFAAILGAAGLAIGLALQGTLSHVASGVMLLLFRPFKIGDYVKAGGEEGTVKDLSLFTTEMATIDNRKLIIPNGKIWDDTITNFSAHDLRRLDMIFGVSYSDDLNKVRRVIKGVITEDPRIHDDPEPIIEVDSLGDFSVNFTVRMWLEGSDYFKVKWAMNQKIKEAFDQEDISIPFPTAIEYQGELMGEGKGTLEEG